MIDRGPNQDAMPMGANAARDALDDDATYKDASYLGTSEDDDEEVRDLGFIVDDHDDRRAMWTDGWQRLDTVDTDEPLETNRSGEIPHAEALRERGVAPERFATDFNVSNADAEAQEEDFVETSLLDSDPSMNAGMDDFTGETLEDSSGMGLSTDIDGRVRGVGMGLGTSVAQDLGRGGFQIRDNPLAQPDGIPTEGELLNDEALALVDGMDQETVLEALERDTDYDR